jgi:hypothetical protein
LAAAIDGYVQNGGKILSTGFTATKNISGKPLNSIRLKSLGVEPGFDLFKRAKSTYLKISDNDKAAFDGKEFKDFSIMMMYSDFMKCKLSAGATGYFRFLPETRFGPPEKSYFTQEDITGFPGLVYNNYGKGKSVLIPWEIGEQYQLKGHYMHRLLFVAALQNLLKVERTVFTDASPLVEVSHLANLNGAFEWLGLINHSGQISGSFREPVTMSGINIRFRPAKPVKELKLMQSGKSVAFKQSGGWIDCTIPSLTDFEMLLCLYQ